MEKLSLIVFVLSLSVLVYTFFGYPVALCALSALFGKRPRWRECCPRVSLIISTYNEEKVIREKIENSLALDYPRDLLEIIVASESTDGTDDIVREYAGKGVVLHGYKGREGKRATLFRTVPLAKGEIIVFSDANAIYRPDAVRKLVGNFSDPGVGCVSGRLVYLNPKRSNIGAAETCYWEYDMALKRLASRLRVLGGGANGSIFAIRKELYNPIDRHRGDDYEISCRVELAGFGAVLESGAVSYEETSQSTRQEFRRKVRLATWNLKSTLMLLGEAARKKRALTFFILFSHRLLRYTTPVWLALLLASNAFLLGGWLGYLFPLQGLFYLSAALGYMMERLSGRVFRPLVAPLYFCMVNIAAFMALSKNILGRTETLWEKAR